MAEQESNSEPIRVNRIQLNLSFTAKDDTPPPKLSDLVAAVSAKLGAGYEVALDGVELNYSACVYPVAVAQPSSALPGDEVLAAGKKTPPAFLKDEEEEDPKAKDDGEDDEEDEDKKKKGKPFPPKA